MTSDHVAEDSATDDGASNRGATDHSTADHSTAEESTTVESISGMLLPALDHADTGFAVIQPSASWPDAAPDDLTVAYANPAHTALYGRSGGTDASPVWAAAAAVLKTGEPVQIGELAVGQRTLRVSCTPVRADQPATGVTVVSVDITDQVRIRRRLQDQHQRLSVLNDATAAITAELEPARELIALAESVVPSLADACAIYLVDHTTAAGPQLDPLQATRLVCVIDPALGQVSPAPEVRLRLVTNRPVARAAREGRPVLARSPQVDPRDWGERWLGVLNPHSLVAVPIGDPGAVRAVVSFAAVGERPGYEDSDIALMRELTARVDAAVARALHLQHTSQVALTLQRGLLSDPPPVEGLDIRVRYRPAGPGLEIGGDWYDAFVLPAGSVALTVGDIVGHDLYAASTMGQLRSMVQALASQPDAEPAKVMTALNRLCTHLRVGELATVVHGQLTRPNGTEPARFTWTNAGHPPPLLIGPDQSATVLERDAAPLLCLIDTEYGNASVEIPVGAVLLLYTDGLMEDPDRPSADAIHELARMAADRSGVGLDELCDQLIATAPSRDDIALLAVQVMS